MAKMGFHGKMIEALAGPPEEMGPNVKALYDRFMADPDEECIAAESQIVLLFGNALNQDNQRQSQ